MKPTCIALASLLAVIAATPSHGAGPPTARDPEAQRKALADAEACAAIIIDAARRHGAADLPALAKATGLRVQQLNPAAVKLFHLTSADDILRENVARIVSPEPYQRAMVSAMNAVGVCRYLAEYQLYVEETILYDRQYHVVIAILRDVTEREAMRMKDDQLRRQTVDTADRVIDKQMRVVQEIASLLGETTAETKLALSKLKDAMRHE